jgi:hypothetical protein
MCAWFQRDDHVLLQLPAQAQALQAGRGAAVGQARAVAAHIVRVDALLSIKVDLKRCLPSLPRSCCTFAMLAPNQTVCMGSR